MQGLGAGIYYPAISASIQRLFSGRQRSKAFGYMGGVIGVSTAVGPLLGGAIIELAGLSDGWRWIFLVNLFIGVVEVPAAIKLLALIAVALLCGLGLPRTLGAERASENR